MTYRAANNKFQPPLPSSIRHAVVQYGVWAQVRVDHGREFYLTLFVQEKLRAQCGPRDVLPYVQSPSTEVGK